MIVNHNASHLHYNNVSCILDVCLLCCNDCVLLGLDWAEPMIFFLVCISHVHAFSCIRTFNSLYSFILFCWCFFDCLFPSLSLFLALVCSMAPKCKFTPSQNPLQSRAFTSSSDPTPSHVRFYDDKA